VQQGSVRVAGRAILGGDLAIRTRLDPICVKRRELQVMPAGITGSISKPPARKDKKGIPLVCLHTAGADGRQCLGLLNAASVADRFRVIAFDLLCHGTSSAPKGWQDEDYRLTRMPSPASSWRSSPRSASNGRA
jgi:pimeloyl-ACP methyl ester carboxylesterase